jgi:xanthine dehydrogenase YagS FAD-binding subunit
MIVLPKTPDEAVSAVGEYRAGGTELQERRRQGISDGSIVDLRDVSALRGLEVTEDGGLRIGAGTRMAELAELAEVREGYPGFAAAAEGLATPQIRAVGTLGGNLLQRTRCWYYRSPEATCLKKGGNRCYAREGDHLFHACFDLGSCVSVHPSTLGMALLAYDASVQIHGGGARSVAELYGDGSDARRDHHLEEGALLTAVTLPPPRRGERAAYFRAISRSRSEWPLVEVLARLVVEGETITDAWVAVGGVAPRPLRRPEVEVALKGKPATAETLEAAAQHAAAGATPLPMTTYKVDLLPRTVLETLERALAAEPVVVPEPETPPDSKVDRLPQTQPSSDQGSL